MPISSLIKILQKLYEEHGDLDVRYYQCGESPDDIRDVDFEINSFGPYIEIS